MKAVAYCRVSTKEQVKNTSLETQQQAICAYCESEGIEIGPCVSRRRRIRQDRRPHPAPGTPRLLPQQPG